MDTGKKFIKDFINRTLPMDDVIATTIAENFHPVQYSKNDFLLQTGKICSNFLLLETGFARAYTYDADGNEVTTGFYKTPSIVFEVASYFKRTPSNENIQALTDCTGWAASYDDFQILFHSIPAFREFGRANLVNGFIALKERMLAMINLTAEQRYANLMATRPDIIQHAPLKYIASYLGITDTSLSRIRKEFAQK
jgi:CRP-like cAMP-binding protein